jgi:hypothetical protein
MMAGPTSVWPGANTARSYTEKLQKARFAKQYASRVDRLVGWLSTADARRLSGGFSSRPVALTRNVEPCTVAERAWP